MAQYELTPEEAKVIDRMRLSPTEKRAAALLETQTRLTEGLAKVSDALAKPELAAAVARVRQAQAPATKEG
ncbi:MAG: hypothetical protein NT049_08575 [Planctomycetota bacterium]|nr:hypothetical protein [Planctomycetota bacterium]